jgi:ABC-type antimicrobial peptide transport system permease subunit
MTRFGFILRNLRYFKGVNLALIVGMLVATAVLTGAMMVGNSVQASLANLARQRLGKIDDALVGRRFFSESLVTRLAADPRLAGRYSIVPAILLQGGAANERETVRAGDVQIGAVGSDWVPLSLGQSILNGPTAEALGVTTTDTMILLSAPTKPDQPREATLSKRSREDTLSTIRTSVKAIDNSSDMLALFNPNGGQRVPENAWVNLAELQDQIDVRGTVNTILVHDQSGSESVASAEPLNSVLRDIVRLEDYSLKLEAGKNGDVLLTSRAGSLDPPLIAAAETAANKAGIVLSKVTVNLINSVSVGSNGRKSHYAVAAGISSLGEKDLADDEIAINQWMADQLGARLGDRLHLTYYKRQPDGNLSNVTSETAGFKDGFRIAQILPMTGLGADPSLTPEYRGLTDANSMADWNPPEGIQIDKSLVTKADEAYWKKYKAAPKLFFNFRAAEKLWGSPIAEVTSLRLPANRADEFRQKLHDELDPAAMGLVFQPIKAQQLAASSGSTDFSQLFIGFSFFIILAAILLVAMLFRLNVEQRARQLGLLSAVGFAPSSLRRLSLTEGMSLAAIGGLLGLPAAIAYTWLIMYGLRTWWNGAVGTTSLYLHVAPTTLIYGYVGSLLVAFFAIVWAVWRIGRTSAATLLAGGWGATSRTRRGGGWLRITGIALIGIALASFVWAIHDRSNAQWSFLGGGTLLLFGCLCWLGGALRPGHQRSIGASGIATIRRLGIRNASRHTARSVLAIGLISFAAFTLITVAAFREGTPTNTGDVDSGAGGYRLVISAGIPLLGDLNTKQARQVLGMTDAESPFWNDLHFVSMRRWAGQDISCLNLTKPTTPTILSVPAEMTRAPDANHKHRFKFVEGTGDNPWLLLDQPQSDGSIPVIAHDNTAQYILHVSVGSTIDVPDAAGTPRHLKLVATLSNSIFQSELLMGEANFRQLFPTQAGYGVVLVDAPANKVTPVQQALNTQLGEYAVNTEPTAYRLARYLNIENTYLSTFEALGALGLMLGTIGLAVVLVRTVIERKAELALLASLGFGQSARITLVLSENIFLLILGLGVGAVCALLGIIPTIYQSAQSINFTALGGTLLGVLCVGMISSLLAVWISGAHVTPADLRRE